MNLQERRIALVCMTPATDADELGGMELPSYGIRRILAALVDDPRFEGAEIALIDVAKPDVDAYVEAIDSFHPDLIGMSVYVWSLPCLVEVARRVKRRRPECLIVFGGPSARTAVFDLAPYAQPTEYLDAVVASEGELTFRDIASSDELSRLALESVPGIALPTELDWTWTETRPAIRDLDRIASPFQIGLMPQDTVAYLETFRGCPLGCTFCEWGAGDKSSGTVFSMEYLVRELESYVRYRASAVFLVDAGLNLNARGFRHLRDAERQVGALATAGLWAEIYPSRVQDEHLEFLSSVGTTYLGIGLQSVDPEVLRLHNRPFHQERFEHSVRRLADVATAEVQIIFGLPGDTPDGFHRTLAYARSLPVAVRAYHCLVLPDALLTRGKEDWNMHYDPITLEMKSCLGWTARDLDAMREYLTETAIGIGGKAGDYWWYFPRED